MFVCFQTEANEGKWQLQETELCLVVARGMRTVRAGGAELLEAGSRESCKGQPKAVFVGTIKLDDSAGFYCVMERALGEFLASL